MNFSQFIEVVMDRTITSIQPLQIFRIDHEEDWELGARVEDIANKVHIRPNRNKNVTIVATVGDDEVIGGIFSCIYHNDGLVEYDFDVVVHPQWQGYQNVGLKLIDAAIKEAQQSDCHVVTAYVVNARLARVLSDKYNFDGIYPNWNGQPIKMYRYI